MKNIKKTVLASVAAIGVSAALIGGATLALFTSEAGADLTITSGKVNVTAEVVEESIKYYTMDQATETEKEDGWLGGSEGSYADGKFTLNNITPGAGLSFQLKITNNSTVDIKYQFKLTGKNLSESEYNLIDAFKVVAENDGEAIPFINTGSEIATVWTAVEAGTQEDLGTYDVDIYLPWTTGKNYQGLECSLSIGVYAVQGNANVYDPVVPNTEWDGETINDLSDLMAFRNAVNEGDDMNGKTITLNEDLDLGGIENWEPIGTSANPFRGTFDGGNKTISNVTVNYPEQDYVGFFGLLNGHVNNVTFKGAKVTGKAAVGVAVGDSFNVGYISGVTVLNSSAAGLKNIGGIVGGGYTHIEKCTVDGFTGVATPALNDKSVLDDGDKVGGIVGYSADSNYTMKNCTVKNANLTAYRDLGSVAGAYNGANVLTQVTGLTVENVTLTVDHTVDAGSSAINVRQVIGRITVGPDSDTVNQKLLSTESVKDITIVGKGNVEMAGWNYNASTGRTDSFTGNIDGLTFKNIKFTAPACFHTSIADIKIKGVTFEECEFDLSNLNWETNTSAQAIHYYNENNNQKTTDLKVIGCTFTNCFQGVYTHHAVNVEVSGCKFESLKHNAIAIQDHVAAPISHGEIVITNNTFTNITERPIRFGHLDENTTLTITGNVAKNAQDGAGEVMKTKTFAEDIKASANISGNDWNGTDKDGVEVMIVG